MYYLGIDLGGTNIAVGVVNDAYKIVGRGQRKTNLPRPAEAILDDMAAAAEEAVADAGLTMADIVGCGIGSPGSVDIKTGMIYTSNNLKFDNLPMKQEMEARLKVNCIVHNDANAAALGEMLCGAGKGTKSFVAITLGTGVGGGVILNNQMLTGSYYAGAELGHMVIAMNGEPCKCGREGCWETYASATALIRQTKQKMEECKDSKMWEIAEANGGKVDGRTAFDGMRAGDIAAKAVVDRFCEYVAVGATNIVNIFQPEVLCIGGGISKEGETLLSPIRSYVRNNCYGKNHSEHTEIKAAELGNDAGIIGAAFLHTLS
ncbi:MAG: ROK family protein [Clostridia bacterium]|nr:ROK family protein [Clostridia bacterium]